MSQINGKQIKNTTVSLSKLSGLGTASLSGTASYILSGHSVAEYDLAADGAILVSRDYVDSKVASGSLGVQAGEGVSIITVSGPSGSISELDVILQSTDGSITVATGGPGVAIDLTTDGDQITVGSNISVTGATSGTSITDTLNTIQNNLDNSSPLAGTGINIDSSSNGATVSVDLDGIAGLGLTAVGTQIDVNHGNSLEINSDVLDVAISAKSNGLLTIESDGLHISSLTTQEIYVDNTAINGDQASIETQVESRLDFWATHTGTQTGGGATAGLHVGDMVIFINVNEVHAGSTQTSGTHSLQAIRTQVVVNDHTDFVKLHSPNVDDIHIRGLFSAGNGLTYSTLTGQFATDVDALAGAGLVDNGGVFDFVVGSTDGVNVTVNADSVDFETSGVISTIGATFTGITAGAGDSIHTALTQLDQAITTNQVQAENGLTSVGSTVKLGGTLTENTSIDGDSGNNNMTIFDVGDFGVQGLDISLDSPLANINLSQQGTVTIGGKSFAMNISATGTSAAIITDSGDEHGLQYASDYSSTFLDNSLVTKKFVEDHVNSNAAAIEVSATNSGLTAVTSGATVSLAVQVDNGLSVDATDNKIKLGGSLNEYTVIDAAGERLEITDLDSFEITSPGGRQTFDMKEFRLSFTGSSNGAIITDGGTGEGLQYAADYSATFLDNSLITKKFVDDSIAAVTGSYIDDIVAGTGISLPNGGTAGSVTIEANADATLTTDMTALGLTAGVSSIMDALTALQGGGSKNVSDVTATFSNTSGDDSNTTIAVSGDPVDGHEVNVYINGQLQTYGTSNDYYFSTDGTSGNAVAQNAVDTGYILVWNGSLAGFELVQGDDVITITYDVVV